MVKRELKSCSMDAFLGFKDYAEIAGFLYKHGHHKIAKKDINEAIDGFFGLIFKNAS